MGIARDRARMVTSEDAIDVELKMKKDSDRGTIDWTTTFPDRSKAHADSHLIAVSERCIYSFLLKQRPGSAWSRLSRPFKTEFMV